MTWILILGANGQLPRNTTQYLCRSKRLANPDPLRVTVVEGDVLDLPALGRDAGS
jgi:hypothetical protein